ncbi:MAG: hypothetical protein ABDH63_04725 [Candidatus Caldarchaeales archaeon]
MEASEAIKRLPGVIEVAVVMATEANKELLRSQGILTPEGDRAGPNDIVIALKGVGLTEGVLRKAREVLFQMKPRTARYASIDDALHENPDIRMASISIPGQHVKDVAFKLLERGVNLFVFSDHVPIEVEVAMKREAAARNLLVMGPEAGTSIIGGVGFGFANRVIRGPVGIVASSGSGIQELSVILHDMGVGISHAIGVGGRDMTRAVGGLMTRESLRLLDGDRSTKVIVLLAKQSDAELVKRVLEDAKIGKPLLLCLLGHKEKISEHPQLPTLHATALKACSLVSPQAYSKALSALEREVTSLKEKVDGGGHPRGFYCGGTLATETAFLWSEAGIEVYSNLELPWTKKLDDPLRSRGATVVDYGSEEFTAGRVHPIIDPSLRNRRITQELASPETGSIAFDLIIGYGAPVDAVSRTLEEVGPALATGERKRVSARVVGTGEDPQWDQTRELSKYPLITTGSNAVTAAFAAACAEEDASVLHHLIERFVLSEVT